MERPTRADDDPEAVAAGARAAHSHQPPHSFQAPLLPAPIEPVVDHDEHDLIRRAQAGEESAFAALVRRHQQRAFRIARQMVPSEEDARDLVQDAFLRVFKSLDRFDFQFTFATWLHRIVTNLAIDLLRKRRLLASTHASGDEEEADLELADERQVAPSERLEASETADRVRACINSLAPHFRTVLTLRELEGMPCNEIAKVVGATHVTVRWRLHRGRKLFQEEWERRERARASGAGGEELGGGANNEPGRDVQDDYQPDEDQS